MQISGVVLILALAHAADLSENNQVNEMQTLRAENKRLQGENRNLLSKNDELQAQITVLRAQLVTEGTNNGAPKQLLDFETENMVEAGAAKGDGEGDGEGDGQMDAAARQMWPQRSRTCSSAATHCRGDCNIPKTWVGTHRWNNGRDMPLFGADCALSPEVYNHIKERVASVGSSRWEVDWNTVDAQQRVLSKQKITVHCPCHAARGGRLDAETALRLIIGQVAATGVPRDLARQIASGHMRGDTFIMRLALATTKMFTCWQQACSTSLTGSGLDDLLIEAGATDTAGWDCG